MYNKLGIGPVVGSALLLVVAVVAVIGFQNWYTTFQSTTLVDIDQESSSSNSLQIQGLSYGNLYFKSGESNISFLRIISEKTGTEMCSFSENGEVNSSGLVGLWKLDDESSVIEDLSGNENHGTLYGNTRLLLDFDDGSANDKTGYNNSGVVTGATHTTSDCVNGGCYQFDGIDDMIRYNVSNFDNVKGTISIWFKKDQDIIGNRLFSNYFSDSHRTSISVWRDSISIYSGHSASQELSLIYNSPENISGWNQITYVYDYDIDSFKLYINGNLENSTISNISVHNIGEFVFGATKDYDIPGYYGSYFNGSIDEIGIYSKVLSSSEVIDLYNSQKAKFIEFVDSPIDKAIEFDGINDYINITDLNGDLDFNNSDSFSIFTSFIPEFDNSYLQVLVKGSISGGYPYKIEISPNNDLLTTGIYDGTYTNSILRKEQISNNKKYVILAVKDSNNLLGYLNGDLISNSTFNLSNTISDSGNLLIGRRENDLCGPNPCNYNGIIDEIRIYNRSLTQEETKQLYFYSIKQTDEGTNSIDLSSCNLENNQPYQIQLFTNEGSVIESRFNN